VSFSRRYNEAIA